MGRVKFYKNTRLSFQIDYNKQETQLAKQEKYFKICWQLLCKGMRLGGNYMFSTTLHEYDIIELCQMLNYRQQKNSRKT